MITDMVNTLATYLRDKKIFEIVYKYNVPSATSVKKNTFAGIIAPTQLTNNGERNMGLDSTYLRIACYVRCDTASIYPPKMDDLISKMDNLFPFTSNGITYRVQSVLPPLFDNQAFFVYYIILRTTK